MKYLVKLVFGIAPEVYQQLTVKSRSWFGLKIFALFLSLLVSNIVALEIASTAFGIQSPFILCLCCLIYTMIVGAFDILLMSGAIPSFLRLLYSFAMVCLSSISIFMVLTKEDLTVKREQEINSRIERVRQEYVENKMQRFATVLALRNEREQYHASVCAPEARNRQAGPLYQSKHQHCQVLEQKEKFEEEAFEAKEASYLDECEQEIKRIENSSKLGFFEKVRETIKLIQSDWVKILVAIALFILVSSLEGVAYFASFRKCGSEVEELQEQFARNSKEIALETLKADKEMAIEEIRISKAKSSMKSRIQHMTENIRIRKIMDEAVGEGTALNALEVLTREAIEGMLYDAVGLYRPAGRIVNFNEQYTPEVVFNCTDPMLKVAEQCWSDAGQDVERYMKHVFEWCVENVVYQKTHDKSHYKNARETFISRTGICGESTILFIAFMRAKGVNADFVVVDVDVHGKAVNHASALVSINGREALVDIAYKKFDVQHQAWTRKTDEELMAYLIAWNR